jgi:hypothetical protein
MVTPLSVVGVSSDELTLVADLITRKSAPYATSETKGFPPPGTCLYLD